MPFTSGYCAFSSPCLWALMGVQLLPQENVLGTNKKRTDLNRRGDIV